MNNSIFKSHKLEYDSTADQLPDKFIISPDKFGINDFSYNCTGKDVKICVIGTGSCEHAAIRNIVHMVNMGNTQTYKDELGYSCIVSGILSADDDNLVGLAPGSHIYFCKATDSDNHIDENNIAASILWAVVAEVNIIVISNAWTKNFPVIEAAIKKAVECNIIVISDGTIKNTMYPHSYDGVISVADDFDPSEKSIVLPDDLGHIWSTFLGQKYVKVETAKFGAAILGGIAAMLYEFNSAVDPTKNCPDGILKQIKSCFSKSQ